MTRGLAWLPALIALAAPLPALAQARAPRLRARTVAELAQPLPSTYDAHRDGRRDVARALVRAGQSGKPLLVDLGANWCPGCRVLSGVLALPEMRAWISRHFEFVQVDIGRFDRNMDIATYFGSDAVRSVPAVLVVDGKTRKLVNKGAVFAIGDVNEPQAIADWLARWAR